MNSKNIISGEKFQLIADLTITNQRIKTFHHSLSKDIKIFDIENNNSFPFSKEELDKIKIVFIYTDLIHLFFCKHFIDQFTNPIVIITHNSDFCIDYNMIHYINHPKVKHWFAQNLLIRHFKTTPIPIGIANSMWNHGNLDLIRDISKMNLKKDNLLYFNFNVLTNPSVRTPIKNILLKNGFNEKSNLTQKDYLMDITKSHFVACPDGNGIDSHRIWETLYLNSIPIVQNNFFNSQWEDLPLLKIDDWNMITDEYLQKELKNIFKIKYNFNQLNFKYWENVIKNT
jgi:hypothetical protein